MDPIAVALDTRDRGELDRLADATEPSIGVFKVGLTTVAALGPGIVGDLSHRKPVFVDLKLHDIPAQVAGAVAAVGELGASYTTVHASGGRDMMRAALEAAPEHLVILAVTVLTSLDEGALDQIGMAGPVEKAVVRLAELAMEAGVRGLVCSPVEIAALRARFGPPSAGGPMLVVPGIRARGEGPQDQRRTLSAREAIEAGADLIVVGRPITSAPDPATAARALALEVGGR